MTKTVPLVLAALLTGAVVAGSLKIVLRKKPVGLEACGDHCEVPAPSSGESRPALSPSLVKLERPPQSRPMVSLAEASVAGKPVTEAPKAKADPLSDALSMPERTRPEKESKESTLNRLLSERTVPILQQRFDAGLTEPFLEDPSSVEARNGEEIYAVMMKPEGAGAYRTALPRSDYPDLYRLHDERNRLRKEIARLAEEPLAVTKEPPSGSPR
jgi:hypothetical protein